MLCNDLKGWDGGVEKRLKRERIYIYILMVDSHFCMTETNTKLK